VKTLIAFGILLAAGFIGAVKLFHRLEVSSPFSYLFYSGTVFIFFGLIIGENGFNLISREIIHHLEPLIHFSLGWVGFIFGFQLELKFLKRVRWTWYLNLASTYFTTFFAVFFSSFFTIRYFSGESIQAADIVIGFALVMAIIIPESSVSFVVWSSKFFKKHFQHVRLCSFIASSDNFFPILVTGIVFSLYRYHPELHEISSIPGTGFLISFAIQLGIGIMSGLLLHFLLKRIEEKLEISAVLLGVIFFISGLSLMFNYSPLFVAMITGAVFSNLTRRHSYFLKIINPTEKPIYLIFLVFLTVQKAELDMGLVLLAVILLAVKLLSKGMTFKALNLVKPDRFDTSSYFSYILLPLGSIVPAIILDLFIAFPDETTRKIAGIFIFSQLFLELFAPAAIKIAQHHLGGKNARGIKGTKT
jgi:hypothetical protein